MNRLTSFLSSQINKMSVFGGVSNGGISTNDADTNITCEVDPMAFLMESPTDITTPIMAICTDSSRHGGAIYYDSSVQLIADRKDPGNPYKGLDIMIHNIAPDYVIVSEVQSKLIDYLEARFTFKTLDLGRKRSISSTVLQGVASCSAPAIEYDDSQQSNRSQEEHRFKRPRLDSRCIDKPGTSRGNQSNAPLDQEYDTSNILSGNNDSLDAAFTLILAPNPWFSMSRGLQKLVDSELVESKGFVEAQDKNFFITTRVNKATDVCAIRAISAIDNYIIHAFSDLNKSKTKPCSQVSRLTEATQTQQLRGSRGQEPSMRLDNLMSILAIKYVEPGPTLSIDKTSLQSLYVFPTGQRGITKNKHKSDEPSESDNPPSAEESSFVSLYELLNQCESPQGRKQMRSIMLWPLQDLDELRRRHDVVDFFVQSENRLFRDQLCLNIKNVVPLTGLLTKLTHAVASSKELTTFYKTFWAFVCVIDLIKANNNHDLDILKRIAACDSEEMRNSVSSMVSIIDFENSRKMGKVQVNAGVDEELDEKLELRSNLDKFCDEVAIEETARYKDTLGKIFRVFYLPRVGFLADVDYRNSSELEKIATMKEFDVILYTETTVYFKTPKMNQLDNNAGDIVCDLIDIQVNVVMNLQEDLLKHSETLLKLMELCGELDCLLSFALVSFQHAYTRPEFIPGNETLEILDLYHPLCATSEQMRPNNVRYYKQSSERAVRVMVITGPNSCGKTTYMKATCLAIYMAHIGCFVPALLAKIPNFDAIFTRIHSPDSISTGLSSFATDLRQINYALSRATNRSFLAVDEFGKGTQARDGFHLLKGLLTYFCVRAQSSPYVMVATHFNRLADHMKSYSEYIIYKTFKVRKESENRIVYEYQVIDGVSEASFADKVAIRAGIPPLLIERANQIRDYITEGRPLNVRPPTGA